MRMPGEAALPSAEDAAQQAAHRRARADLAGVGLDPRALDRLEQRAANRMRHAVHGDPVERQREAPLPIDAAGDLDRGHDAADHGAGWNQHAAILLQVDQGRGFESILDLRRPGVERGLQPHVDLGADGNRGPSSPGAGVRAGRSFVAPRARLEILEAVAHVGVLDDGQGVLLAQPDLQVGHFVLQAAQLGLERARRRAVAGAKRGDVLADRRD